MSTHNQAIRWISAAIACFGTVFFAAGMLVGYLAAKGLS